MDNKEYTTTYGNKCLDEVIDDFVKGIYSWNQVEKYMEWNGFDKDDVNVNKILKARTTYINKERSKL